MNSYDNNGQINNYNNSYMQRKIPYVTAVLVAINVVVFLVMEFFGSTESGEYMYAHGASYAPDIFENGQWYRILTSMFMHFGAEHLINNMVMLYILGYQIEENFGRVKYLITYFICGIAGGIISSGEYSISAGASGAIFGIFGVLLVMIFKSRKQLGQVSAPRLILLFILMVFGNMQEGVDWMAHLGGAVTGVVIALAIYRPGNKPLHL
jgi:rhomboid protease GluP